MLKLLFSNVITHSPWRQSIQSVAVSTSTLRHSSFISSPEVRPIEQYPEVDVVQNAVEWKYVERILPALTVPKPLLKNEYPSGWKMPTKKGDTKYIIARTKNYMVPVYLETTYRGQRRVTLVRKIHGDIWALEQDLRSVVEKARNGRSCATRVNEMSGQIRIHGDYVDIVREFIKQNGY